MKGHPGTSLGGLSVGALPTGGVYKSFFSGILPRNIFTGIVHEITIGSGIIQSTYSKGVIREHLWGIIYRSIINGGDYESFSSGTLPRTSSGGLFTRSPSVGRLLRTPPARGSSWGRREAAAKKEAAERTEVADQQSSISSSLWGYHTNQRQYGSITTTVEYERDTLVDWMGTLGDSVGSQGDSSLVLANIELATDEHSYGSSSLHMHKSHTSQKQSGSVTTTVGYEKVEMHEDSNVGDEYSYGSYYLHMSKPKSPPTPGW